MGLLDFLQRRSRRPIRSGDALLGRLAARLPPDGGPGLLAPPTPAEAEAERRLGERFAAELHAYGATPPLGLQRRLAAVAAAARRGRSDELAEAVEGLSPWELPAFLEELADRKDLPAAALAATARRLADEATDWAILGAALALLAVAPEPGDLERLRLCARTTALAGICAMSAEPLGLEALLELARVADGLGLALVLERLGLAAAEAPDRLAPLAAEAIRLAGSIEDSPSRAYAAVPLLEFADVPALLAADPSLAEPVASLLEAAARGGWNGGPGPGLGRLPGAIRAAEALLASGADPAVRLRGARAVLDAHPMPQGPVRKAAQELVAG